MRISLCVAGSGGRLKSGRHCRGINRRCHARRRNGRRYIAVHRAVNGVCRVHPRIAVVQIGRKVAERAVWLGVDAYQVFIRRHNRVVISYLYAGFDIHGNQYSQRVVIHEHVRYFKIVPSNHRRYFRRLRFRSCVVHACRIINCGAHFRGPVRGSHIYHDA
jgi:hypothetical protein